MVSLRATDNCGMAILENISSADNAAEVLRFIRDDIGDELTFLIFSGVVRYDDRPHPSELKEMGFAGKNYGNLLKRLIEKLKLGRVTAGPIANNSNSGNDIRVWLYQPDWDALTDLSDEDIDDAIKPKPRKKPQPKKPAKRVTWGQSVRRRSWIR